MRTRRGGLDDDLAMEEWQRLRALQITGEGDEFDPLTPVRLADDLPIGDWQRARSRQMGGGLAPSGAARPAGAYRLAAASGPLTGRPGTAAVVAGALNTIASGPNTSAPLHVKGVNGVVRRGGGDDVSAEGKIGGFGSVGAQGVLEPPTGRAEVGISKVRGRGAVKLPDRVRFFNTPGGELDVHLPSDVRIGVVPVARKGTYVIGQPDPPRRK